MNLFAEQVAGHSLVAKCNRQRNNKVPSNDRLGPEQKKKKSGKRRQSEKVDEAK